jgi:hypothetical protein
MAGDTMYTAPVAVGSGRSTRTGSGTHVFNTPRGARRVVRKDSNPMWVPPDWYYYEEARKHGVRVAHLGSGSSVDVGAGRRLVMRQGVAGLLNADGRFDALPRDEHLVFGRTLFIPPLGSVNRRLPGVLGMYRLDLGDGVGMHGTPYPETVGEAATHGCLRLLDADIEWLYRYVPVGTTVIII